MGIMSTRDIKTPPFTPLSDKKELSALDERLERFLKSFDEDKERGYTIANLYMEVKQFKNEQQRHRARLEYLDSRIDEHTDRINGHDERLDAHGNALIHIKRRLRTDEHDKEMTTGNFDLAAIQREVEDQKIKRMNSERAKAEETIWWKRQIILWIMAGFGFIAVTTITILITLAIAASGHK